MGHSNHILRILGMPDPTGQAGKFLKLNTGETTLEYDIVGSSTKFGVSGEDDLATSNRSFDLDGNDFTISNGGIFSILTGSTIEIDGQDLYFPSLPSNVDYDTIMGWRLSDGRVGKLLLGTGLSISDDGIDSYLDAAVTTSLPINALTAATGSNNINNGSHSQQWRWDSISGSYGLLLTSASTGNAHGIAFMQMTGAYANANQSGTALNISNVMTGTTSTNTGLSVSASGATLNYGLLVTNGLTGLGTDTPTELLTLGKNGGTKGVLSFFGNTSGKIIIQPASAAGTYTLTLPTTDGNSGEFLQTDGSGVLTWATAGTTYTIQNGLYEDTGNIIKLGGVLTENTTIGDIEAETHDLTIGVNDLNLSALNDLNIAVVSDVVLAVGTLTINNLTGDDTKTRVLVQDAATNRVYYRTDTSLGGDAISRSVSSISSTTSAGSTAKTDYVYIATNTFTLTLPTAVGNTNTYTIKNAGTGVITINTTSSQTIDDSLTQTMNVQNLTYTIISDNSKWHIISSYLPSSMYTSIGKSEALDLGYALP